MLVIITKLQMIRTKLFALVVAGLSIVETTEAVTVTNLSDLDTEAAT